MERCCRLYGNLHGSLKIVKEGPYVAAMKLWNSEPFSFKFGVRFTQFTLDLTFMPAAPGGPFVPASALAVIEGKAMVFITIKETEATTFSDYENMNR